MDARQFLTCCAENLAHSLKPNGAIKELADNTDIIGAYAEASVREMVRRVAQPLQICTGGVIDVAVPPSEVPQLDTILWAPSPLPTVFAAGDFGLVPRSSCFGILEIKRSAYSKVAKQIAKRAEMAERLVADVAKIVQATELPSQPYFLGVICLGYGDDIARIEKLEQKGQVIVLLRDTGSGFEPDAAAVHKLMNFLVAARLRWWHMVGRDFVRMGAFTDDLQPAQT
jgi:hypothetical protein